MMRFDMEKFDIQKFWNDRFDRNFKQAVETERTTGFDAAEPHYTKLYKGGNLLAGVRLGTCYSAGHGYRVDYPRAIRIFEDCIEKGNPLAAAMLARMYYYGCGVEADEEAARELYSSCVEGLEIMCRECYDEARYIRGLDLYRGTFGEVDAERGVDLIRKAADAGCVEACVRMGDFFYYGETVGWDLKMSSVYYNKAIKHGNREAEIMLCYLDIEGEISLERFVQNLTKLDDQLAQDEKEKKTGKHTPNLNALTGFLWMQCFKQNDKYGEYALEHYCKALAVGGRVLYDSAVLCFDYGLESRTHPLDRGEFLEKIKNAARKEEDARFELLLGRIYDEGAAVPGSLEEAAAWYQTAFDKTGDKYAGFYLVKHYRSEGQPEKASGLLADMADEGSPEAAYFLALVLRDGDGTEPDNGKAREYLELAAKNGSEKARRILDRWENWAAWEREADFSGGAVSPGGVCTDTDQGRDILETIRLLEEKVDALRERYENTGAEEDGYALFGTQCALGDGWLELHRPTKARNIFLSLLELGEELDLVFRTTQARRCLATGYEKLGVTGSNLDGDNLFEARNYSIKARDLRKRLYAEMGAVQDGRALADCYGLLGMDDSVFGEWDTAEYHYEKAMEIYERIYEESGSAEDACNLAKYYRLAGENYERLSEKYPKKSRKYEDRIQSCRDKSLELCEKAYAERPTCASRRALAYSYMAMGDEAKRDGILSVTGRNFYEKGRAIFEELYEERKTPEACRDLFLIYMRLGWLLDKLPEYFAYFLKAAVIAKQLYKESPTLQARLDLRKICLILHGLYQVMGNEDKQSYYIELANELTDGLRENLQYYEEMAFQREYYMEGAPVIPFSGLSGSFDDIEASVSEWTLEPISAREPVRKKSAERTSDAPKGKADYAALNADRKTVIYGNNMLIAVKNDGRVYYTSDFSEGSTKQMGEWSGKWGDIIAITMVFATSCAVAGLRADGTVVLWGGDSFTKGFFSECWRWRDIVAISSAHRLLVGLKRDGTVVATGDGRFSQCDVEDFSDIVQIGCGQFHTVGLRSDGTVMAAGRDNEIGEESPGGFIWYEMDDPRRIGGLRSECRVEDWRNIEEIRAATCATFGRRSDGVWLEVGEDAERHKDLKDSIYSLKLDNGMAARLRSDGILDVEGCTSPEVSRWTDIRLPENYRNGIWVND